jgi:hypothetical protein
MDGPFDSAWLKWGRGVVHAHSLEVELRAYIAQPDREEITLGFCHYDPKRHGFPVEIAEVAPWPAIWGALLGDIVGNVRSALDHCAWAIVQRGKGGVGGLPLSDPEASLVYFPIVHTSAKQFNGDIVSKLIGAGRRDIAVVRKAQPYHGGKTRHHRHALFVLNKLAKGDKHRMLAVVAMMLTDGNYTILSATDCIASSDSRRPRARLIRAEPGEELGVIRVRKAGPNPSLEVDARIAARPGIADRTPLADWAQVTILLIRNVLLTFADPPLDELAQLGDPLWFFPNGVPSFFPRVPAPRA